MGNIISEKDYPIQTIWLFKRISISFIILPIMMIFILSAGGVSVIFSPDFSQILLFLIFTVFVLGILVAIDVLKRSNFHYLFEEKIIVLHQGIIFKENRNVPYGVIQGVFLHEGEYLKKYLAWLP